MKKSRVLIVDDEHDIRIMLGLMIKKVLDCTVISIGEVERFKREVNDMEVDIAFLDISLKDGSGYDVLPILREKFGEALTVFMISAFDNPQEQEQALAAGADAFIPKPLTKTKIQKNLMAHYPKPVPKL